jgi:hypothetical protein
MNLSLKDEFANANPKELLPQNLPPKWLSYLGLRVNDFLQQYAEIESSPSKFEKRIKFDPDILDIVTRLYVAVHGDHQIDTSDIHNILEFQKATQKGAINYCLAVYRESLGRDSGIKFEQPSLETILTKPPETYDCHDLMQLARKNNCKECSGCTPQTEPLPGIKPPDAQ